MTDLADTAAARIARLDAALQRRGEDVVLRKTNSTTGQVTVRARVRDYRPDELVGIIRQGDSKVVLSPTGLESFGVPPQNGFAVVAGKPRSIAAATPVRIGGTLVRIDLQVRG